MKKWNISSEFLKVFALVAMTADHTTRIFHDTDFISNTLGRMAFPIFSFLLITNFCKYHPVKKYLLRLGLFALLTQCILFIFPIPTNNVLFTFLYAIGFLSLAEYLQGRYSLCEQCYYLILAFLLASPLIAFSSYGFLGFFFLVALYAYIKKPSSINYLSVLISAIALNFKTPLTIAFTVITVVALLSYIQVKSSRRHTKWWFFYLYYPLHQVLLWGLKTMLG